VQGRIALSRTATHRKPSASFAFVSLGCAKNTVDSERMLGLLAQDGLILTPEPEDADLVIINTCGFIEAARQESLAVIREMLELKRQGQVKAVVVAGCLAERLREQLLQELPEIDALVGVFGREEIAQVCREVLQITSAPNRKQNKSRRKKNQAEPKSAKVSPAEMPQARTEPPFSQQGRRALPILDESPADPRWLAIVEQRTLFRPAPSRPFSDQARLRITPRHYAYLKISEGCDRLCTFCAIPRMRGKHVSKPLEQILAEARELAGDGVVELNLVAQDLTYYGLDLYGRPMLAELLRQLETVDGIRWIRLLYLYPMYITDELLGVIADSEKILHYLDIPLQHINDRVLRRMQRRVTRSDIEQLLRRLRQAIPDLVLRTTMIVGFPGETEAQFEELCEFVAQGHFQRLGVFTYSYEPDTPSARMDGHLPEEVKVARRNRLMEIQQQVAFAWAEKQVGRQLQVLIEGRDQQGRLLGRSYADAPEIDGLVYVRRSSCRPGELVPVTISSADGYDLVGEMVSASESACSSPSAPQTV
jgi:ribosomal protein S12 methylthiotransferase RimO